jgi:hypothetical protein
MFLHRTNDKACMNSISTEILELIENMHRCAFIGNNPVAQTCGLEGENTSCKQLNAKILLNFDFLSH